MVPLTKPRPIYFASPAEFRAWFEKHCDSAVEVWVGYHKRATGRPSMTWPQSVDEALCFGWIDGIRKRIDDDRYTIRFTRRKATSNWSRINIARVAELQKLGRMTAAGLAACEERKAKYDYSYEETRSRSFTTKQKAIFRANRKAWAFFEHRAPSYRRTLIYWVTNAKKEETRMSRLLRLIEACAAGRRIGDSFTNRTRPNSPRRQRT